MRKLQRLSNWENSSFNNEVVTFAVAQFFEFDPGA